jgi:hypothetical protein
MVPAALAEVRDIGCAREPHPRATRLIARLGDGRAACETPELCYWANDEFRVDFFNYGQRLKVGKVPPSDCDVVFDGESLPLVQLDALDGEDSISLSPACKAAIRRNYRTISAAPRPLGVIMAGHLR